MGLADEKGGDRKGGWTDQGPNDLAYLPIGQVTFAGIPFEVIDPSKNDGKAAILLRSTTWEFFPLQTDWIPVDASVPVLYVLHGVAWGTAGENPYATIALKYRDGKTAEIPLRIDREATDWHIARAVPNGPLAWIGKNDSTIKIGLHILEWANPRPGEPIDAIQFRSSAGQPAPGFLAATIATKKLPIGDPSRQLREKSLAEVIVRHQARAPLCRYFEPAETKTLTVRRMLPQAVQRLKKLEVHLRFARTPGEVSVEVAGKTLTRRIGQEDWTVTLAIDDPKTLKRIQAGTDLPISIHAAGDLRLGKYLYDTSPNVPWTSDGQDAENALYAVTLGPSSRRTTRSSHDGSTSSHQRPGEGGPRLSWKTGRPSRPESCLRPLEQPYSSTAFGNWPRRDRSGRRRSFRPRSGCRACGPYRRV
jgi:hypothetical protein